MAARVLGEQLGETGKSQVIDAFVEKQRKQSGNLRVAETPTAKPSDGGRLSVAAEAG